MTFDIKKFLKDTKAGPYGMIQESARKDNSIKENYKDMNEEEGMDDPDMEAQHDRIMDLGGDNIEKGIISLMDDGFDVQDIIDLCNKIIRNAWA